MDKSRNDKYFKNSYSQINLWYSSTSSVDLAKIRLTEFPANLLVSDNTVGSFFNGNLMTNRPSWFRVC